MLTKIKSSSGIVLLTLAYFIYVFTFICYPIKSENSIILNQLSPINCHFCQISNAYIKPYIEPIVDTTINPTIDTVKKIDNDLKISRTLVQLQKIDSKYGIQAGYDKFIDLIQDSINWFQLNIEPYISLFINQINLKFKIYINLITNFINSYFLIPINKQFLKIWYIITSNSIFNQLINSSHASNLQNRSLFLQKEFKNLIKFNEFYPKEFKSNIINVVKEVLGKGYQDKEEDWEDVEDEEADLTEETIVITQTISVYENGAIATNNISPELFEIYNEIEKWEKKINKTIELAEINLVEEVEPIVNDTIAELKPKISEILQDLQKENHLQYKDLNLKISQINKDFEKIKKSNNTKIETVSRQEIRDDIQKSYDLATNYSTKIQDLINKEHENLLIKYFNSIQQTIDILDSFADSSINEFSTQLTQLISKNKINESKTWSIWKKFHFIKNLLFKFRDELLHNSNEYKLDNKNPEIKHKVIGLKEWNTYLNNIEFHLNYLIRDNGDYLRLIRAKANVAFQMREELVYNLEKAKNDKEEEEKRKIEEQKSQQREIEEKQKEEEDKKKQVEEAKVETEQQSKVEHDTKTEDKSVVEEIIEEEEEIIVPEEHQEQEQEPKDEEQQEEQQQQQQQQQQPQEEEKEEEIKKPNLDEIKDEEDGIEDEDEKDEENIDEIILETEAS